MKKLIPFLMFCFITTTSFAQNVMYIYNSSPFKVQMQITALNSSGDADPTLTSNAYIIIPPGTPSTPTVYTFTNFNNTAPASLTSQFIGWTENLSGVNTNITKASAQLLYGNPFPTWDHIKFDILDSDTEDILGSSGLASPISGYYPNFYPHPFSPGSPMSSGSFTATWNVYPFPLSATIVQFNGTL